MFLNHTRVLGRMRELKRLADTLDSSPNQTLEEAIQTEAGNNGENEAQPPPLPPEVEHSGNSVDPASRAAKMVAEATEVLRRLSPSVDDIETEIAEFAELTRRLQHKIAQARMVPIGTLYTGIAQAVQDAAKAADKQVECEFAGSDTRLDNQTLQRIANPLLHLVRNAVAHGIEGPEERYEAGKPECGKVVVRAYPDGESLCLQVEDDGRGIDWKQVRQTAAHLGWTKSEAARLTVEQLQKLIFQPGFTSAHRPSELAGRGVGLDVVRASLDTFHGEIELETQVGLGSRFTLKVPLTRLVSQAIFVRSGTQMFAFPEPAVKEILCLPASEIEEKRGRLFTRVRKITTEVVRLDQRLGLTRTNPVDGHSYLVLVRHAGGQVGILVDEAVGKEDIVVKNLGECLRNAKLFSGVALGPDGTLAPLIDIGQLLQSPDLGYDQGREFVTFEEMHP